MKKQDCYIEYLNASKGFSKTKKTFKSYKQAETWGKKNLSNYHTDMIKFEKQ